MKRCRWVRQRLVAYVCGRLTRDVSSVVGEHLRNCRSCWQLHQEIAAGAAALRRLRPSQPPPRTLMSLRARLAALEPERQVRWPLAFGRFAAVAAIVVAVMIASAPWVYVAYSNDSARLTGELGQLKSHIERAGLVEWLGEAPGGLVGPKTAADARLLLQEVVNAAERGSVSQVEAKLLRERVVQSKLLERVREIVPKMSGADQKRSRELAAILERLARL